MSLVFQNPITVIFVTLTPSAVNVLVICLGKKVCIPTNKLSNENQQTAGSKQPTFMARSLALGFLFNYISLSTLLRRTYAAPSDGNLLFSIFIVFIFIFIFITFPQRTGNATQKNLQKRARWLHDASSGEWHER